MSTIDVSSELELTQVRRQNLRKTFEQIKLQSSSILFLALQWTDMESHFDSVENAIVQRHEQLVSVEESLRKQLEEVKSREERVELLQESVNCKLIEIEVNEANEKLLFEERMKEFDSMGVALVEQSREIEMSRAAVEEGIKSLNLKEKCFRVLEKSTDRGKKELEDLQTSVKESFAEFEIIREKHLNSVKEWGEERIKDIEMREARIDESLNAIELEKKDIKLKENKLTEQEKTIMFKEKRLLEMENTFKLEEKRLEEHSAELELLERKVKELAEEVKQRVKEVELKEKMNEEYQKTVIAMEDSLMESYLEIGLKEDMVNKQCMIRVESMENELAERCKEIDVKENGLLERIKEVDLKHDTLAQRLKEVDLKEVLLDQRINEVEMKEKQIELRSVVNETIVKESAEIVAYDVNNKVFGESTGNIVVDNLMCKQAGLSVITNGQSLQMYLNKHCNEYKVIHDEVTATLKESPDPAKVVLDAMQGFYPLSTENGNPNMRLRVIRESCILLLEGLLRVSPEISSDTKDGAAKLAFDWTTKIRKEPENDVEVLGFLLLLAAYDLASGFDSTELMIYLLVVTRHRQASRLCRRLGLVDKISDFIAYLIKERKHLDAFELVWTFKLAGKFPPVPLLRAYLWNSKQTSMTNCRVGVNSPTERNVFNKRIADVNRVIKCIRDQNRYCRHPSRNLRNSVLEQTQSKANIIRKKHALNGTKVPQLSSSPSSRLMSNILQQQKSPPGTRISTSDLKACSSADSVSPSMQFPRRQGSYTGQVSGASSTQIKTKQKKVQNLRTNENNVRCKATFEQLMMVPANMRHHSKEAAIKLALQLKTNINGETTTEMDAFRFLQLVANYYLASSFAADELICYLKKVQRRRQTPDLFGPLGLLNEVPGFVEDLIKKDCCLDAIRYICRFDLKHKFPPVPILKTYLNGMDEKTRMLALRYREDQKYSVNRELLATRTVLEHIKNHKLEQEYPPKILEDRIKQLEDHKAAYATSNKLMQQKNGNNISTSKADAAIVSIDVITNKSEFVDEGEEGSDLPWEFL